MSEEVELGGKGKDDDYEVVPVGPLRKLERRVDELQEQKQQQKGGSGTNDELVHDVLDIMKSNQKIVNEMTESTHELKNSVEDLTHKMDEVVDNMNTFMDLLTEASEMDMEGEIVGDMEGRIAEAIGNKMDEVAEEMNKSNQEVVEHLKQVNESLRKSYASQNKQGLVSRQNKTNNVNVGGQEGQSSRKEQGIGRGGPNVNAENGGSMDLGSDNSDRLKRLRKKFDKKKNEK